MMSSPRSLHSVPASNAGGAALVIVLTFVVLITGLMVAFFSRAMTSRQLSNSSAGQTRAAILAKSAADIVIAGFKKEIVDLSASKLDSYGTAPNVYNVYTPKAAINVVPVRYPVPSTTSDLIPNLVRESVRNDSQGGTLPTPAVPSYASALTTSVDTNTAANERPSDGRFITKARWNSHFLIRSKSTAYTTDSTPDDDPNTGVKFTAPDWVMVTREKGPAVLSSPTKDVGGSTVTVMGRYAYAVYDEGGLLDMNVAGYPVVTPAPAPAATGFTPAQISRKGSLALADLTQLPLVKSPASVDPTVDAASYLSATVVNGIVGWRNNAAAANSTSGVAPLSPFPNISFSATQATNWFTNFVSNATGYTTVYGGKSNNTGTSDQAFLSRQALLRLRSSLNASLAPQGFPFGANALQYMGTFSRSLEQPSYVPAHIQYPTTAPAIIGSATPPPAGTTTHPNVDDYAGNNDAAGIQISSGLPYQDVYNPSLLSTRVTKAFVRPDGTMAAIGEQFLKKKFPLSRLSEIRYTDTDSTPSRNDPTPTQNHIKEWFGLSRTDASSPWTYNHGGVLGAAVYILSLKEVAALGREPDFAELLKATINVGSLAKGGPGLAPSKGNYQYTLDVAVDYQVLQIMANLIDQADADSFPTVIQIAASGTVNRTFRGVEDLPYFYRYHPMSVVTQLPSPLLSKNDVVTFTSGANTDTARGCKVDTAVGSPGQAIYMYVPDVWNPHDVSTSLTTPANARPARFRLAVFTNDPTLQTGYWKTGAWAVVNGDPAALPKNIVIPGAPKALGSGVAGSPTVESATSFTFSDANGTLFREPTLLFRLDAPTGANIAVDTGSLAGPYTDINSGIKYVGVQIAKTVVSYSAPISAGWTTTPPNTTGKVLCQGDSYNDNNFSVTNGQYANYTFRLQYLDPNNSSKWITYDEKYPDFHGVAGPKIVANTADYPGEQWRNVYNSKQLNNSSTGFDPRSPRFGIGTEANGSEATGPFLEPGAFANSDNTATVVVTQRPGSDRGNHVNYSNPGMTSDPGRSLQMRWFDGVGFSASNGQNTSPLEYDGLLSQNDPRQYLSSTRQGITSQVRIYYEDADGVARRATAAYFGDTIPGQAPAALASVYTPTNLEGLPMATANSYSSANGVGMPNDQNLSRPIILNRPFRSVGEMSCTFRGSPWKNIDFFTPESGDAAMLDVFCVNELPTNAIVAGKVNLNTHQAPVLKAIIAGVARDETNNIPGVAINTLPPITSGEAALAAAKLVGITTDVTNAWRGPLTNISQLVGHFVPVAPSPPASSGINDYYTYNEPATNVKYSYAGLSAALDSTVYTLKSAQTTKIQRMRESAIRALTDTGHTRVWNLMIDVVAQTGRYAPNSNILAQFNVDGETRYWIHVAIDRYTGEIIDKQVEVVNE